MFTSESAAPQRSQRRTSTSSSDRSEDSSTSSGSSRRSALLSRLRIYYGGRDCTLPGVNSGLRSRPSMLSDLLQNIEVSDRLNARSIDDRTAATSWETLSMATPLSARGSCDGARKLATSNSHARAILKQSTAPPSLNGLRISNNNNKKSSKSRSGPIGRWVRRRQSLTTSEVNQCIPATGPELYKAVSSGSSVRVIKDLLKENPAVSQYKTPGGMTPLHCALQRHDTSGEILLLLLESNPSIAAARCPFGNENAVDLLWKRFVEPAANRTKAVIEKAQKVRKAMMTVVETCSSRKAHQELRTNKDLRAFWDTVVPFIEAAAQANRPTTKSRPLVLHDCIAIEAPSLLISFAGTLYPDELRKYMDKKKQYLPLHYAVVHCPRLIAPLLALYPRAAQLVDADGRLPLHHAAEAGVSCGLNQLVCAFPQGLPTKDPRTQLLPVLQAGCGDQNLSTIFMLLVAFPSEPMQYALSSEDRQDE